MRYSLFLFITISIGLLIFGACSKDDETSKPTATMPESLYPTGIASFDANGYAFVATQARARYRRNGNGLGIELKDANGKTLVIRLPDFAGVGTYSLANDGSGANYFYSFNSDFISWSSIAGSEVEITDFDENEGVLSGSFSINLKHVANYNYLEQGVLENIPIVELLMPESGHADFFLKDIYYHSENPYAIITNNFQLMVFVPYHQRGYTLALKKYIGLNNYLGFPDLGYSRIYEPGTMFSNGGISMQDFNIDLENEKMSFNTKAEVTTLDFEMKLKDIPITSIPMEVDSGMTKLVIGSVEYEFTESTYSRPPSVGYPKYHFEATNTAGNKLIVDFSYTHSGEDFNLYGYTAGYGVFLEFYENEDDLSPTLKVPGLFGDHHVSANQTAWVGFESDTIKMRGVEIPFIE